MQSTACNATHRIEQRLARWLLTAHDRVGKDQFPLTQEFVAMMLGAARPTVTIVAGTLQRAGLITYRRGLISILNREQLEEASCECYRVTADLLESHLRRRRVARPRLSSDPVPQVGPDIARACAVSDGTGVASRFRIERHSRIHQHRGDPRWRNQAHCTTRFSTNCATRTTGKSS